MFLTDHELTAASSTVAALAIIGGYLGVRSANQNALRIAREERSSQKRNDLTNLKLSVYAKCLANLNSAASASLHSGNPAINQVWQQRGVSAVDAMVAATNSVIELSLVAPIQVSNIAFDALVAAVHSEPGDAEFSPVVMRLQGAMVADLGIVEMP
jgi:hypothetical protein